MTIMDVMKAYNEAYEKNLFSQFKKMNLTESQKKEIIYLDNLKMVLNGSMGYNCKIKYSKKNNNFYLSDSKCPISNEDMCYAEHCVRNMLNG